MVDESEPQEGADIQPAMERFLERYQRLPLHQQIQARQRMDKIRFGSSSSLHDPTVRRGRGRPAGSTNRRHDNSSTQRIPSGFENAARRPRLCGRCRQPGHTVTTCPN